MVTLAVLDKLCAVLPSTGLVLIKSTTFHHLTSLENYFILNCMTMFDRLVYVNTEVPLSVARERIENLKRTAQKNDVQVNFIDCFGAVNDLQVSSCVFKSANIAELIRTQFVKENEKLCIFLPLTLLCLTEGLEEAVQLLDNLTFATRFCMLNQDIVQSIGLIEYISQVIIEPAKMVVQDLSLSILWKKSKLIRSVEHYSVNLNGSLSFVDHVVNSLSFHSVEPSTTDSITAEQKATRDASLPYLKVKQNPTHVYNFHNSLDPDEENDNEIDDDLSI